MSIFSRFLPKKKPVEIKNNIPKEKANIRKAFGIYCHSHHGTSGDKLCPKCTALLATVMTKMNRCPYGITKPICDRCERPCFGAKQTQEFLKIMDSTSKRMFLRHPMMSVKHKLASMGVDRSTLRKVSNLLVVVLVGLAFCAKVEDSGSEALFGKNDIAIVIGAVVIFLAILFARRQKKR